MKNELLTIGPFTVYGYGLMIGIGVIAAYLTAEMRAKKQGLDNGERVFSLVIWCVIGGILGAKLLYLITQYREILADPAQRSSGILRTVLWSTEEYSAGFWQAGCTAGC